MASLASLRASTKGAGEVGRFGVGFAAVRAVSDDITLRSTTGGVRFSAELARAAAARGLLEEGHAGAQSGEPSVLGPATPAAPTRRLAALALGHAASAQDDENTRGERDSGEQGERPVDGALALGHAASAQERLAVLRLPFPAEALGSDDGPFATVVELVLRDADAVAAVREQLGGVGDVVLLALPGLDEVAIEVVTSRGTERRVLRDVTERWHVRRAEGELDAGDVEELPVEQRRLSWSVVWAAPRADRGDGVPRVLHAPTPTEVPLTFSAVLLASFPVDPGRRRVLPGAATDAIARAAGREYAALLGDLVGERGLDVLGLVPGGMPAGELDAALREAALAALSATSLLPAPPQPDHSDEPARIAPRDAVVLAAPLGDDAELAQALGTVAAPQRFEGVLRRLGARIVPLADVLDELPGGLPPARWREVYTALASHVSTPTVREALAGAPVPLADGRVARGVRGLVLPPVDGSLHDVVVEAAETLGVRVVHPEATHPVLERVGAAALEPRALLSDPDVRSRALDAAEELLDGELDDEVPHEVVDAVLRLVAGTVAEGGAARDLPFWLGELPVATTDGDLAPLRETALPGSWAAEALDGLAVVDGDEVDRHGTAALLAAGAHEGFDVYTVRHAVTPADDGAEDHDADPADPAGWLASWTEYLADLAVRWGPDVLVDELEAVADLDAVADDAWPEALRRLAEDPATRRALLSRPRPGAGARTGAEAAPSYTAWWLRRRLGAPFALDGAVPLLPPAPAETRGLDDEVLRALGGIGAADEPEPADWADLLDALPPAGEAMPLRDALTVWRGLTALAERLDPGARTTALPHLPDRLPALLRDGTAEVVDAEELAVAGAARWAQLRPVVPVPPGAVEAVAELLDLPVAATSSSETVITAGETREIDARLRALDPRIPARWRRHDRLEVDGIAVEHWITDDGVPHATGSRGLAGALADLLDAPHLAPLLERALEDPQDAQALWSLTAWSR